MLVDSGASATVISDAMVKAVAATNVKPDVSYKMADGTHIPHMGEKSFHACTDEGHVRHFTAQVTEVDQPLLSVSRMVAAGNTVVIDDSGSYVVHKESGEWIPLVERGGVYTLKMWIPKNQTESPF